MSEEGKTGFIHDLKKQIIAGVTVALTTAGTVFVDEIKVLVGLEPEVEVVVEQPQKPQEIVIKMPEQKTQVKETVIIKEVPAKKEKKKEYDSW